MDSLNNIDKTINGFELMVGPLENINFETQFFDKILQEISIITSPKRFNKNSNSRIVITVDLIRELSLKLKKRSNKYPNNDQQEFLAQLNLYLKQYQFVVSLKRYFHEKIYIPMYLSCYRPHEFLKVNNDDNYDEMSDYFNGFFLTELDASCTDKSKMISNIISCEKQIHCIYIKWTSLLNGNCNDIKLMDLDKIPDIALCHASYKFSHFLFTDLNNKVKKIIELSRCWIKNYRNWSKSQLIYNSYSQYSTAILNKVNNINETIYKLNKEIDNITISIQTKKDDYDDIAIKETNLMEIIAKSDDISESVNNLNDEYEKLLKTRTDLIKDLDKTVSGTYKYQTLSQKITNIESQVNDKYQELRLANYSLKISQEDSVVHCNSIKDFIRWSESLKCSIDDAEKELLVKIDNKKKLEKSLSMINENIDRMKTIVGSKMKEILDEIESVSYCESNGFTMKTYTINDDDRRFGDFDDFLPLPQ